MIRPFGRYGEDAQNPFSSSPRCHGQMARCPRYLLLIWTQARFERRTKNLIAAGLTPIINRIFAAALTGDPEFGTRKQVNGGSIPCLLPTHHMVSVGEEELIKPLYQGLVKKLQGLFADKPSSDFGCTLAAKVEQADVLPRFVEPKPCVVITVLSLPFIFVMVSC